MNCIDMKNITSIYKVCAESEPKYKIEILEGPWDKDYSRTFGDPSVMNEGP